jgi:hypothetical protein
VRTVVTLQVYNSDITKTLSKAESVGIAGEESLGWGWLSRVLL